MKARPRTWQLQEAKNKLSQLVDQALRSGPQLITRRGKKAVMVVSSQQYESMAHPAGRLIDLLRRAPRVPGGLVAERDPGTGRNLDF